MQAGDYYSCTSLGKDTARFLYPTPNARTSKASQAFWQVDDVDRLPS